MEALLRFPTAVKHEPAIDAWLVAQRPDLGGIAKMWFEYMRTRGADVRELMHDGCATACVGDAAFAHVGVYKEHVTIYFFVGALLPDPSGLLEGTGKRGRHVKVRPDSAIDAAALERLVDVAYADMQKRANADS